MTQGCFMKRFRMSKRLFFRSLKSVQNYNLYFVQKPDATGQSGLSGCKNVQQHCVF